MAAKGGVFLWKYPHFVNWFHFYCIIIGSDYSMYKINILTNAGVGVEEEGCVRLRGFEWGGG